MSKIMWRRTNGSLIAIDQMSDQHLKSAIAMMKRNGFISTADKALFDSVRDVPWDNSCDEQRNKPASTLLDALESELMKRTGRNE